jgi:hypothetical protein
MRAKTRRWSAGGTTTATRWSRTESGAGDEVIMSIAGHVSRAMLSRYSHVRMEALDEIAARQRAADEKRKNDAERRGAGRGGLSIGGGSVVTCDGKGSQCPEWLGPNSMAKCSPGIGAGRGPCGWNRPTEGETRGMEGVDPVDKCKTRYIKCMFSVRLPTIWGWSPQRSAGTGCSLPQRS